MYTSTSGHSNIDFIGGSIGSETTLTLATNSSQTAPFKSRYVITVTVASVNFDLGTIGTTTSTIQNGYWASLYNDNTSTGSLVVRNSASTPIVTLQPGYTTVLVANSNVTNGWSLFVAPQGFRPTPNMDRYCTRTNELINLNLITGVIGNTSGADNSGSSAISSITILKSASFGTLTATGPLGAYTYRSNPRFTGTDYIVYSVANNSGTGYKRGTCKIEVQALAPSTSPAKQFIFITQSDPIPGQSAIYQYENDGVDSVIYTDTTSGVSNALATDRQDNLIFWCNLGVIRAYDYVNGVAYTVTDARTDPRFVASGVTQAGLDFRSATFSKGVLYLVGVDSPTNTFNGYYRVVINTYTPSVTPVISNVSFITLSYSVAGSIISTSDIAHNPTDDKIYCYIQRPGTSLRRGTISTDTGICLVRTDTLVPPAPATQNQLVFASDGNCYGVPAPAGTGSQNVLNCGTGSVLFNITTSSAGLNSIDLAPSINQPCQ